MFYLKKILYSYKKKFHENLQKLDLVLKFRFPVTRNCWKVKTLDFELTLLQGAHVQ